MGNNNLSGEGGNFSFHINERPPGKKTSRKYSGRADIEATSTYDIQRLGRILEAAKKNEKQICLFLFLWPMVRERDGVWRREFNCFMQIPERGKWNFGN